MLEIRKNTSGKMTIFKNGEEFSTDTRILLSAGNFVHTSKGNGTLVEYGDKVFLICEDGARIEL